MIGLNFSKKLPNVPGAAAGNAAASSTASAAGSSTASISDFLDLDLSCSWDFFSFSISNCFLCSNFACL